LRERERERAVLEEGAACGRCTGHDAVEVAEEVVDGLGRLRGVGPIALHHTARWRWLREMRER
jgi:hypothetical protein